MNIINYCPRQDGKTERIKKISRSSYDSNDNAIFVLNKRYAKTYESKYNVFYKVDDYIMKYKGLGDYYKPKTLLVDDYDYFDKQYKKDLYLLYTKEKFNVIKIETTPAKKYDKRYIEFIRSAKLNKCSDLDISDYVFNIFPEYGKEFFDELYHNFITEPSFMVQHKSIPFLANGCKLNMYSSEEKRQYQGVLF